MSSSDPLLTTLCSICHVQPPKYRCPRCAIRTCSLACTRRHKSWSSCSGIRDATAYVPPSKLKTAAGVDHDFNFLSGIERAVQRSEKEVVEERGLLAAEDLRPVEVRSVQWRRGKDGTKRRVLVTEVLRNRAGAAAKPDLSKQMKKRLSTCGIFVRRVPTGMTRQRENGTSVAKSSGRINWQVEWLVLDERQQSEDESDSEDSGARKVKRPRTTRVLGKSLDHLPIYTAFFNSRTPQADPAQPKPADEQEAPEQPPKPKKRKQAPPVPEVQDHATATWPLSDYSLQPHPTASWKRYAGTAAFTGLTQAELAQQTAYQYFLSPNPLSKTTDGRIVVHPLDPLTALSEALRDTTVLEFPTIYVLPASAALSDALFNVRPKEPTFRASLTSKRKRQAAPDRKPGKNATARHGKKPRRDLEEGEVPSGDEDDEGDHHGTRGQRSDAEGPADGYEVVAEESLGEEDEDEDEDNDDDDTSSSSGSDDESDDETGDSRVKASLDAKLALLGRKR